MNNPIFIGFGIVAILIIIAFVIQSKRKKADKDPYTPFGNPDIDTVESNIGRPLTSNGPVTTASDDDDEYIDLPMTSILTGRLFTNKVDAVEIYMRGDNSTVRYAIVPEEEGVLYDEHGPEFFKKTFLQPDAYRPNPNIPVYEDPHNPEFMEWNEFARLFLIPGALMAFAEILDEWNDDIHGDEDPDFLEELEDFFEEPDNFYPDDDEEHPVVLDTLFIIDPEESSDSSEHDISASEEATVIMEGLGDMDIRVRDIPEEEVTELVGAENMDFQIEEVLEDDATWPSTPDTTEELSFDPEEEARQFAEEDGEDSHEDIEPGADINEEDPSELEIGDFADEPDEPEVEEEVYEAPEEVVKEEEETQDELEVEEEID